MKTKKTFICIGIIVLLIIAFVIAIFCFTGKERTDVYLKDFNISSDRKTITLDIGTSSSAGYIRKMEKSIKGNKCYLRFYETYGLNSKIGAKDNFSLKLSPDMEEIYFYTDDGKTKVLEKTDTDQWRHTGKEEKIASTSIMVSSDLSEKLIKQCQDTLSSKETLSKIQDKYPDATDIEFKYVPGANIIEFTYICDGQDSKDCAKIVEMYCEILQQMLAGQNITTTQLKPPRVTGRLVTK